MTTTTIAAVPQSTRLSRAARCSITELSPIIDSQTPKYIDGVVSLIWPYSSRTRRTAILLADPDFRIRKAKGQTKVTFEGHSAVAVAESHVGIGDTVHLSLEGAQWTQPDEDVFTTGKRADWDLEYSERVYVEINKGTIPLAVVDVCEVPDSAAHGPLREIDINEGFTTRTPRSRKSEDLWSSPAFAKQKSRPSAPSAETSLSYFVDDDGYVPGKGRKRPRFSRNSASWQYVERSSSSDQGNHVPATTSPTSDPHELSVAGSNRSDRELEDRRHSLEVLELPGSPSQHPEHDYRVTAGFKVEEELSMPPPPLTFAKQQDVVDSPTIRPEAEIGTLFSPQEQQRQQEEQAVTPTRATTPRLFPLTSPGLPPISPLIKRHGVEIGYFPPAPTDQAELDSRAEEISYGVLRGVEPDVVVPLNIPEAPAGQSADSPSAVAVKISTLQSETVTIDPTLPTDEETSPILRLGVRESHHDALDLQQSPSRPSEFQFLKDSPSEPQADSQMRFTGTPAQQGQSGVETLLDSPNRQAFTSEVLNEFTPPAYKAGEADSMQVILEPVDRLVGMSNLEELTSFVTERSVESPGRVVPESNSSVEQIAVEQNHFTALSAAGTSSNWTAALEISAREVEDCNLPISPPPFPFKQRWDKKAKKESIARQHNAAQAAGFNSPHRVSYDGIDDGHQSPYSQSSVVLSSTDSERDSLLYDANGDLIREAVDRSEQSSVLEDDYSQVTHGKGSTALRSEADVASAAPESVLESEDSNSRSIAEPIPGASMIMHSKQAEATDLEDSPKSAGLAVNLTDDGLDHQSPASVVEQDYAQRLSETRLSRSSSLPPRDDVKLSTTSSLPDSHIVEQLTVLAGAERVEHADLATSGPPDQVICRADQLATPENTQQELVDSQDRDSHEELHQGMPLVELPPSPQHTQDLLESQMAKIEELSSLNEEQISTPRDSSEAQPIKHIEEIEKAEKLAAPVSSKESRRRRSPRLSGKMPLLGKDPSEIVSPYFTPKQPGQQQEHDVISSSLPRRAFSPKRKGHENIVVVIPHPEKTRSSSDAPKTPTSPSPTDGKSPLTRLPGHAKGFTTPHSYYPSLMSLPDHFHGVVEILAVATTTTKQPQRAKSGPKDFFISLKLADFSCDADDTISVQLFRPYKNALPSCERGDILLLRGMKVQTRRSLGSRGKSQGKKSVDGMMLLSTESSAWAVFKFSGVDSISTANERPKSTDSNTRSPAKRSLPKKLYIQINGPPLEFGPEERAYARGMNKWWIEEGEELFPDARNTGNQKTRSKDKGMKNDNMEGVIEGERLHEHELRDGMAYGDLISPRPLHEHSHHTGQIHHADGEEMLHEHELRDGMAYGDTIEPQPPHEHFDIHDDSEHHHHQDLHNEMNTQFSSPAEESNTHLHNRHTDVSGNDPDAASPLAASSPLLGQTTRTRARAAAAAAAHEKENT
jgi:Telomeric single stranded DNA binding POT1/CDC13